MDQNSLLICSAITIFFIGMKVIEYKYILKVEIPFKDIIKDGVLVYISSIFGLYLNEKLQTKLDLKSTTSAFVNEPNF